MAIIQNEKKKVLPELDRQGLKVLRAYRHKATKGVYNLAGFAFREHDLVPVVIYSDIYTGTIFTRPVKEFTSKFDIIEKKK